MSDVKIPVEQTLLDNLGSIFYTLDRAYMSRLESDYGVLPFDEKYNEDGFVSYPSNIRALRVKRCVFDKEEKISDCFKNVLAVFANSEESLALVIRRSPNSTEMFFVVKNVGHGHNETSKNNIALLADSLRGNFPGTEIEIIEDRNGGADTKTALGFGKAKAISVLSNLPSEKSEDYISQGIEKLINGIVPKSEEDSYTIVFLMEATPLVEIRNILRGYEEMATAIVPFMGYQFQTGKNETNTKGEMKSMTHSEGVSHSISKTHSVNIGINGGLFGSITDALSIGGGAIPFSLGSSIVKSLAKSIGASIGLSGGYGYSWGNTVTKSTTDATTTGVNTSISLGTSQNTTYTYKSYLVSDLIAKLEAVIKRIDESKSTGLWKYAAYVLSSDVKTTINVANFLCAVSQGDESYIEPSIIQSWVYENTNGISMFSEIDKYVTHFCHPVFANLKDGAVVTPAVYASTDELANVVAFPRHSVQNIPVLECVRFGHEPHGLIPIKKDVEIGYAYHMRQCLSARVFLDKQALAKHTFITGSTGSGKSNAIYTLLERVCLCGKRDVTFLVIEPAKGEYKDVFGGHADVTVYGTNPFKVPNLLKINPFSFPDDVHVLEHIDRLVEVFNACWPMYAAMPALLKESVEKAYEECGWNLRLSRNPGRFPTFEDLLAILPKVVDSSAYSADTSNDYKGALVTRIRSLTRGIHGQIFASDVLAKDLFNRNAIVDISRVGSSETKALIMGVLILKLQEFRMSEQGESHNSPLRHVTVLEEAHNLLRRTSSEQSQESSNLQGKSVEMLANAIAEMRTYGEGFVIADQSPGLMDMSVIRNTNTKIIMRLPDESDRLLVGRAAGLTDLQITEIARLEMGVAAISQSDWLEAVLCKIDYFDDKKPMRKQDYSFVDTESVSMRQFLNNAFDVERMKLSRDAVDMVRAWYNANCVDDKVRPYVETVLCGGNITAKQQMLIAASITKNRIKSIPDRERAVAEVEKSLIGQFCFNSNDEIIRRINELFLIHFPANIYTETVQKIEGNNGGVK